MRVEHWKLLPWGSLSSLKRRSVILRFNGWEGGGREERRRKGGVGETGERKKRKKFRRRKEVAETV